MHIKDAQKIHFIGIGGIGISALARMMLYRGVHISGTNDNESKETLDSLRDAGVSITVSTDPADVPTDVDAFVYSVAWEGRAPQVLAQARATGKPMYTYFAALGEIAQEYRVVAIAGTHGKTTTTAMTAQALIASGLDPTVIVGSLVNWPDGTRSNFHPGRSDVLVVEACEYKRHFLNFKPYILGITNIEAEHLDYYKDLADVQSAFDTLQSQSEVVLGEESIMRFLPQVPALRVPGEHNRKDAALALAICDALGASMDSVHEALSDFTGTWRRFERVGVTQEGVVVYDDYAHHPSEIQATLAGAREIAEPGSHIIAVFEAHTYSRTEKLINEFATAFADASEVIIAPIYAAREEQIPGVTHEFLASHIRLHHARVSSAASLAEAREAAMASAKRGDMVVFMGAGDIYKEAIQAIQ